MKTPNFATWVAVVLLVTILVLFALLIIVSPGGMGEPPRAAGARVCVLCPHTAGIVGKPRRLVWRNRGQL